MTRAYFSLGTNVGCRALYLSQGVRMVTENDVSRVSRVYRSEPVGGVAQDDFWNLILEVETLATPRELLARARRAEAARLASKSRLRTRRI